jgi:hypothetical protein
MERDAPKRRLFRTTLLIGAASVLLLAAHPAAAQRAPGAVQHYPAAFFAAAHPQNALDMIERLPGFTLIDSDADVRGFAGATGNVLIDGAPPSTKSQSLEDVLKRLPAGAVARIDVIAGGAPGIDMAGHDVVANVVRIAGGAGETTTAAGGGGARDHVVWPNASLDLTRHWGAGRLDAGLGVATKFDEDAGAGSIADLSPDGALLSRAGRRQWEVKQTLSGRLGWDSKLFGGDLSADASLQRERKTEAVSIAGGETDDERAIDTEGEAGAHWRHPLGDGERIELVALQRIGRLRDVSSSIEDDDRERFTERSDTAETIGRIVFRRERGALVLEAAAEGTINRLDSRAALSENGVAVDLPGSTAHVREDRGELSLSATWRAAPRLTLEPSVAVERSTIGQHGDTRLSRRFTYWKPRLAVTYALGGDDQLRGAIERQVGQLDFEDFVASATLDRNQVTAGAVDLRPPRTWLLSAAIEHHFAGSGAVTIEARHESIADVVDHSVLRAANGDLFDVIGNIGHGTRDTLSLDATLPMAQLTGLAGSSIVADVTLIRSRVSDPVTATHRWISKDKPVEGTISWREDVPGGRWSWQADLALGQRQREYRLDEVRTESYAMRLDAHIDYRPAPAWTIRVEADNITALTHRDRHDGYDGLRDGGAPDTIELRRTATTPTVSFSIRKRLGGVS